MNHHETDDMGPLTAWETVLIFGAATVAAGALAIIVTCAVIRWAI